MSRQIDDQLYTETVGDPDILVAVGKAFLLQLVPWRIAMQKHTECFDGVALNLLVHKMKGSCQAVFATNAAAEFYRAEKALHHMNAADWPAWYVRLMALVQEIETDLQALVTVAERSH